MKGVDKMILLDVDKLSEETIIKIGKDLNILSKDAVVSEDNIDMVVNETWFYLDLTLPSYVVKCGNKQGSFRLEICS